LACPWGVVGRDAEAASEVIALRSSVRVEGVGAQLWVVNQSPEGPTLRHGGPRCHLGIMSYRAENSGNYHRELGEGGWIGKAGTGMNDGGSPLLYK